MAACVNDGFSSRHSSMPSSSVPERFTRGMPYVSAESMWKCASTNGGETSCPCASMVCRDSGRRSRATDAMRPPSHAIVIRSRPSGNTALMTARSNIVSRRSASLRSVQAIAGVAEAGNDIAVLVEMAVDGRGIDGHVGMVRVEVLEPFRTRQETHELDGAGPRLLETLDGGHRRVSGGEHRIDDDGIAIAHLAGHFEVVLDGGERLGVAVE